MLPVAGGYLRRNLHNAHDTLDIQDTQSKILVLIFSKSIHESLLLSQSPIFYPLS